MVRDREPMDFDMRLQKARNANDGLIKNKKDSSSEDGKTKAMRISTELIVSIIVGGCLGFFLDKWLGTKPWFLLGFLLWIVLDFLNVLFMFFLFCLLCLC